jgi:hypothetical protein
MQQRSYDGSSPHFEDPALNAVFEECCDALQRRFAQLREDGPRHAELESVRPHVGRVAAAAVQNGVAPERVIILLKRVVRSLPNINPWRDSERERISHQLVEMLITAYYGDGDGDGDGRKRR